MKIFFVLLCVYKEKTKKKKQTKTTEASLWDTTIELFETDDECRKEKMNMNVFKGR